MKRLALIVALMLMPVAACSQVPVTAAVVNPLSREPFYAMIVKDAGNLKATTEGFAKAPSLALLSQPGFTKYAEAITDLSARDLKGHQDLKKRGTDNDLKCVLMGVSLDLPIKLKAIQAATTEAELKRALNDMALLLGDNIDVIVTPATADSGLDCVIEFGDK
ncbi:hypothetical protein PQU92_07660 [Asticcacaulis sp. BYS171W]|uniref:Uncharacterized protein n=1 Tax=Asticcacaulis aquaticus TaxID=2984212 RepID=A0ABT5HSX3_9CAUL|nr:hypothetical protein [Asticcacaulis aquaticus]MDC7683149.1 hypothetical protein [Asticcacaulis aquaticus]